ncbi:MAG: site-specific integrase [Desulfovibrionaceae bacterium]|nr:site-specific integrase [Desulfovibrionaceae bacterium]
MKSETSGKRTNAFPDAKLTKTFVEKLETTGKRYNAFDADLKGFCVRVGSNGSKGFFYVYRAGRGRAAPLKWLKIGTFPSITVDQARQIAREKAATVALGADPAATLQEEKTALSIAEALDAFYSEYVVKLKPNSIAFYKTAIAKHLKLSMGKVRAKKLGYSEIARFHAALGSKPYMANRCIAVLSVFLNWCELHGYRDKHSNPCKELKLYKEHKRQEFMGATELAILGETLERMEKTWHERKETKTRRPSEIEDVDTITPHMAAAIRLLLLSGARRDEILSLEWKNIDLRQGIARIPDSKTGFKVIQLPAPAVAVLESLPQYSEWVFPAGSASGHMVNIRMAWVNVLKQSGLTGWRIHDLRHAFASAMVNSGASLPIIGKILGHTQTSTTQRYAHLEENPARKAAEEAAKKIQNAMQSKPRKGKVVAFKAAQGA